MPYNAIVLIKQVPDTKNISGNVMKEDGTLNRAALPVITNPEDVNALEMALAFRDTHGGSVTVMTMGPPRAADSLRDALSRGADEGILISDRRLGGSDTWATAYALSCAVKKRGGFQFVFCGRQAIDGDTAQVGPQVAENLEIPHISYVDAIESVNGSTVTIRRATEYGIESIQSPLPLLLTVLGSANDPRYPAARRLMKFKKAQTPPEVSATTQSEEEAREKITLLKSRNMLIEHWDAETAGIDLSRVGLRASPTRVYHVESVVLKSSGFKRIEPNPEGMHGLYNELKADHVLD